MKKQVFEIKDIDKQYYENELKDFLPENIIDIHTHVYYAKFRAKKRDANNVTWTQLVAKENPIEDIKETYKTMFPKKNVTPVIFSMLSSKNDDFEGGNNYIKECSEKHNYPALYFARPTESAIIIEEKLTKESFAGVKVYLSLSDSSINSEDITIFDFLPHHQLEILNRHNAIAMLHIPRSGRLKDPINLEQMLTIEERYPNVKLIIAHVGRAYCTEDLGDAFKQLSKTKNMLFDFSANTNEHVFEELIKSVGPKRILFGSDLPITRMRMRRVCENGKYVNIVPPGLYGDTSNDPNMQEATPEEGSKLSFFLYEEIVAFKRAAEKLNLSKRDIEDVFYNNAKRIL